MAKNLLSIYDLSQKQIWEILKLALDLKKNKKAPKLLEGKTLGMIFEKPSTRTTVSFAVAMHQLGGFPLLLNAQNLQTKRGESLHDTSLTMSRYVDGVVFRTFKHADVEEYIKWSSIPVVNGLTDLEHPCQVLADILTVIEKKKIRNPADLKKIHVAFVGDGNNIANSWLGAAGLLGFKFTLARPSGYGPDKKILIKAYYHAKKTGAKIEVLTDPKQAVKDADIVYTDVWISMGDESQKKKRKNAFKKYQINQKLLCLAKKDCYVMHCLPANRGEEITADVMDGKQSIVFDQAENRLHLQKAVLAYLLK
ncbi:ornithine carbamoyltransferase [Elusimicrobiota bacterium]